MSRKKKTLAEIVEKLQRSWPDLSPDLIDTAINDLKVLKKLRHAPSDKKAHYEYDDETFPILDKTMRGKYPSEVRETPSTLAEALLWKLGKWNSYLEFVADYKDGKNDHKDRDTAIVFYGFAKHLQKETNPIFDQHAARALWAISDELWGSNGVNTSLDRPCSYQGHSGDLFFHYLVRQNGNWKDVGEGNTAMACYRLYCRQIRKVCDRSLLGQELFDCLLMPLGQALKDYSESDGNETKLAGESTPYERFLRIIGRSSPSRDVIKKRRTIALASQKKLAKAARG